MFPKDRDKLSLINAVGQCICQSVSDLRGLQRRKLQWTAPAQTLLAIALANRLGRGYKGEMKKGEEQGKKARGGSRNCLGLVAMVRGRLCRSLEQ
jgi:hypothetical protein